MKKLFENVYEKDKKLYTLNSNPNFFGDDIIKINDKEYRQWEATRSKLAAAIAKGLKTFPINHETKILYLGAAHGYTCSHLANICINGNIFAVEFAPRVARELILLAEKGKNIMPLIADANRPERYYHYLQAADLVYQDIAQRNQVEIFLKNCNVFLKRNGYAMLALKARSIDVTERPQKIFAEVKRQLEAEMKVIDYRNLEPFQKDHAFFVCQKR